jgi:hypothetical protein
VPSPHPAVRGLLVWMQANTPRLRALMGEEAADADDLSPAGDAAVRAQLRFVAEALAANAGPGQAADLEDFAAELPARLEAAEGRVAEVEERMADAAAFEAERQFGESARDDPSLAALLERRFRLNAWMRLFLEALDDARPGRAPVTPAATAWMTAHQDHLADTIFGIDRAAKRAELARGGPDAIASPEVVNRIGQAASLQGHVRFLVEALGGPLAATAA